MLGRIAGTALMLVALFALSACDRSFGRDSATTADAVRKEIEGEIARGVEATRSKDIEAYMEGIPTDLVIHDDTGGVVTRDQLRASALRDWAIIPATLDIEVTIDSLRLHGDSATVWTYQRWERLMLRPDGSASDTVLTTQRHRETWRRTNSRWRQYAVEELGGTVHINGEPYRDR